MDNLIKQKIELSAAFRWTARLDMHESVVNHFSVCVKNDSSKFLVNPGGMHFSLLKASDLICIDTYDIKKSTKHLHEDKKPLETALDLHASIHREINNAKCILHVHSKYATIVSTLKKGKNSKWPGCIPPIDQNTMRFYKRVAEYNSYGGIAKGAEAKRITKKIGDKNILLLANHGVVVIGSTIAKAFYDLYYFEKACETYVKALTTGYDLKILPHKVAEKTARQMENYKPSNIADLYFKSLLKILDKEDSDYKE
jgi:ribulose-5-phosphate 4-epimerase/fuculose-1-phosphate aldolase